MDLSRRSFLKALGFGGIAVALGPRLPLGRAGAAPAVESALAHEPSPSIPVRRLRGLSLQNWSGKAAKATLEDEHGQPLLSLWAMPMVGDVPGSAKWAPYPDQAPAVLPGSTFTIKGEAGQYVPQATLYWTEEDGTSMADQRSGRWESRR